MVEIPAWMLLVLGAGIAALAFLIGLALFAVIDHFADPIDRWLWRKLTPSSTRSEK